jgi:23S rRNA pseudouridine2605 synthase
LNKPSQAKKGTGKPAGSTAKKSPGSRLAGGEKSFSSASPVSRGGAKEDLRGESKGPAKKSPAVKSKGQVAKSPAAKSKSPARKGAPGKSKGPGTKGVAAEGAAAEGLVRLNKFIAASGICSRREADDLIAAGLVSVNGKVITQMGTKVSYSDDVRYNGERMRNERKVYLLLNKPKDYVTTTDDPKERKTVMLLVAQACSERIYPVGRLDRHTTGVLLFTNDGEMAKKLTHPSHNKKKIYHVFLDKSFSAGDLKKLAQGITLDDGFIQPDAISYASKENKREVGLEIHSGQNRIVRRMFESLGYRVVKLDRVYYAGLTKKDLPRGKWRFLTEKEVNRLKMNAYE